jgi:hypothetical protein
MPELRPTPAPPAVAPDLSRVSELKPEDTRAVLDFLSFRPVHTVVMTSFIRDNGIESDLNRGRFYGYRNISGVLEGVALIGHTTLVEARSEKALKALAITARRAETPIHLIMSSGDSATDFWHHFRRDDSVPRLTCVEARFEVSFPFAVSPCEWELQPAKMRHLLPVAEAQAEVAFIESGVDPLVKDREGFLKRVARRIRQERVFVALDGDELVFKADIIAETDEVIYLEGVYVAPQYRDRNIGSSCLSSLSLQLLARVENICLLSNVDLVAAHKSFVKAGYKNTDVCVSLFV